MPATRDTPTIIRTLTTSINSNQRDKNNNVPRVAAIFRSVFMKRLFAVMSVPAVLAIAGCAHSPDKPTASTGNAMAPMSSTDNASPSAVDLHNTVCPVSGDKVESSKLTRTYDGKVYHLCCNDCVKPFEKDPAKYAKAVSDDPAKYGVTTQKSQ